MKTLMLTIALCAALAVAGCGGDDDSSTASTEATEASRAATTDESADKGETAKKTKPNVTVPQGAPPKKLEINELEPGNGTEAKAGDEVSVQYVGVNYKNGQEFDSSWSRNEPLTFGLGEGRVIPGWEQGIEGMKVGGRRELIIPPGLAYGEAGAPPAIGPEETLIFVVDLLEVG